MAGASPIYKFKAHKGEALHRQITKYIRSLILNGELPAGSKLPRMHDLARDWNTNYFTVQTALTSLVREGLVERKPRLGSFVRKQSKELKSVGLYYGDEILVKHERAFHRSLHAQLLMLLQSENIAANVFIDCRPTNIKEEPLPELMEAIQAQTIQGLIVPLPRAGSTWLHNLSIPTSFFSSVKSDTSRIVINHYEIVSLACAALKEQGCRKVAVISPEPKSHAGWGKPESSSIPSAFLSCIKEYDLVTHKSWMRIPRAYPASQEIYGYREFHRLWSQPERPDGLIVYPENVSRGVVLAALENRVRVPAELKIVLHKNQNVEFLCPLHVDWVITQEQEIAKALIQQIKDRFAGLEPRFYEISQKFLHADHVPQVTQALLGVNSLS